MIVLAALTTNATLLTVTLAPTETARAAAVASFAQAQIALAAAQALDTTDIATITGLRVQVVALQA